MADEDARAELLRKFQAAIAGAELDDLRRLTGQLLDVADDDARWTDRPDRRRTPFGDVRMLRVRVELDDSDPVIWRSVDLRSDLTLDAVHEVLQTAFGWADSHLHRFALGGHPFGPTSQLFLCPFDVAEGEDDGLPASDVRLDEVLQESGDVLQYLYDYGDSWELTLQVEEVTPAAPDAPPAVVVAGERAAPPEDSGGASDLAALALVLDDPSHFDLEEVNESLRAAYAFIDAGALDARLRELLVRLRSRGHRGLEQRLPILLGEPLELGSEATTAALAPVQWFLDRAADGGIRLTGAGYLKPDDVQTAAALLPKMTTWYGEANREVHTRPVLEFRESLRSIGLLRKQHGVLSLTQAGVAAQRDTGRLWRHLTDRLVPKRTGSFESAATLLVLAYAGSTTVGTLDLDGVAEALTALGWELESGAPIQRHHLYQLPVLALLENIGVRPAGATRDLDLDPVAAALARAALRRS